MSAPTIRQARASLARRLAAASTATFVVFTLLSLAACDFFIVVLAILFLGPLYPGKPQPPPPPPECPITVPTGGVAEALPDDLEVSPVRADCALPLRPALARQNRDELDRSMQALTGVAPGLKDTLPPETTGAGLDVIAELLTVSPLLIERLEASAADVVDRALRLPGDVPESRVYEAETTITGADPEATGFVNVEDGAKVSMPIFLPLAGTWAIRVRLIAVDGGEGRPKMLVRLNGDTILETELRSGREEAVTVEVRHRLLPNEGSNVVQPVHRLEVENSAYNSEHVLRIDAVEVVGPFDPPTRGAITAALAQLLHCDLDGDLDDAGSTVVGDACAQEAIQIFAHRAWRGQLKADDPERLHALYAQQLDDGDDRETALKTTLTAILLSPRFLFRLELDPVVAVGDDIIAPGVRALNDHELAARLAAYIWSSTPDDRLLELAFQGALRDERVLLAETRRMLDDPRSTALVERFFSMWLGLESLDHARPDPERFPTFDEDLRTSMRCEAELMVDRHFRNNGGLRELLTGEVGALNHRLAQHYGLPPPNTDDDSARGGYVDTSLQGLTRPGLLSTGAIMTMTAQPTRTSPTRRGVWVLEHLMCTVPPPPPPGVEGLIDSEAGEEPDSVRAILESHRQNPECAACHDFIDPMGLPFERYDAVGRVRGSDGRFDVDDSAFWLGDEDDVIRGAGELAERLAEDDLVERCLVQKALSYGTGMLLDDNNNGGCAIDAATAALAVDDDGDARLSDIIINVVTSPAFRARTITVVDPDFSDEDIGNRSRGAP
jgi:hypothetical protein